MTNCSCLWLIICSERCRASLVTKQSVAAAVALIRQCWDTRIWCRHFFSPHREHSQQNLSFKSQFYSCRIRMKLFSSKKFKTDSVQERVLDSSVWGSSSSKSQYKYFVFHCSVENWCHMSSALMTYCLHTAAVTTHLSQFLCKNAVTKVGDCQYFENIQA